MPEKYISLRGDDAREFEEFQEELDEAIPGGVDSNRQTVTAAIDLARSELEIND